MLDFKLIKRLKSGGKIPGNEFTLRSVFQKFIKNLLYRFELSKKWIFEESLSPGYILHTYQDSPVY